MNRTRPVSLLLAGTLAGGLLLMIGPAIAAQPDDPSACADGNLPNLQAMVPHQLQLQNTQQRELLRLTNGIANTGAGPWHLEPLNQVSVDGGTTTAIQTVWDTARGPSDPSSERVCEVATTVFEFHAAHNHWHIGSVARFGVHVADDDGTSGDFGAPVVNDRGVSQSFKTTFCLIDWVRIDGKKKTPDVTYWACDRSAPYQGVSVGWIDQYHHSLEGQEVDITGAPEGIYYLVVHVNDDKVFVESDTEDNIAWRSFRLRRDSQGNPKLTLLATSPCSPASMCGDGIPNR